MTDVISACIKKIKIDEFLCIHFNSEDERRYATFSAYYALLFHKKLKKQLKQTNKKTHAVYEEGAVTDRTCQKWFAKFLGTTDILAK